MNRTSRRTSRRPRELLWLEGAMSAMMVGLTLFAVVSAPAGWHLFAAASAALLLVGLWWVTHGRRWLGFGATLASWAVLGGISPNAAFIAFPLFFLELPLLAGWTGVAAVLVTWCGVVLMLMQRQAHFTYGAVLGPLIGAVVAILTVRSFQALSAVSEHRRQLVDELRATRADLLEAERHAGVLEERERLAAEIHDTLAQGFTSITLLLNSAMRVLDRDSITARELIDQARKTSADNLKEARALVASMTPDDDPTTLDEALERLVARTRELTAAQISLQVDGDTARLSADDQALVLRISQSAVANVVQHSGARTARLALRVGETRAELTISDDGVGFNPNAVGEGHYGLRLMRRRAEAAGGTLDVTSGLGGTRLVVTLPL